MVEIFEIEKKKSKYILKTSLGEYECFEDVIVKYMLLKKASIEDSLFSEILSYSKYVDTLNMAINYLKRPRAKLEVINYLKENNSYDKKVIDKLLDMRLIDDEMYKNMYVDYHSRINLKGPNLIKKELAEKGIYSDFEYKNYDENIEKLTNKYLANNKNKSSAMLNKGLYNYLLQKGYNPTYTNYSNDDSELIEKEFNKLMVKFSKYDKQTKYKKIYQALMYKGYNPSLIKKYLDTIEE